MLDRKETDVSYLMGRLLAVYHVMETATLNGVKRCTKAETLRGMFSKTPVSMTRKFDEMANENWKRRVIKKPRNRWAFYEKEKKEILKMLPDTYFRSETSLDPIYLAGYYAELDYMYLKKEVREALYGKAAEDPNTGSEGDTQNA